APRTVGTEAWPRAGALRAGGAGVRLRDDASHLGGAAGGDQRSVWLPTNASTRPGAPRATMTPLTSFGMVAPLFPVGQLDVRPDQRLRSITHPASAPAPSRPYPTLASAVSVAVDVVPSPVCGALPGT